jgi:hypothetical protein
VAKARTVSRIHLERGFSQLGRNLPVVGGAVVACCTALAPDLIAYARQDVRRRLRDCGARGEAAGDQVGR